ncbi:MAG: hypothetical protein BIP78_0561 [Candidatus Bipolaricaulis sibiricus]|uniref:AMP-binding enzyme C-terminal domain-containing protein n=1 Tax=Bipolaricaulis sibiricus TaxID=2501609 RepID=A0A410FTB8_BIPS1|nr:MAG: hypothetical protein BIP78_0561 [Candidatus Bipolaricaulis sibiricus]
MAFIIPRDAHAVDPQESVDFCARQIAAFKVPRYVVVGKEFPMTASDKVQKYKLAERGKELVASGQVPRSNRAKPGGSSRFLRLCSPWSAIGSDLPLVRGALQGVGTPRNGAVTPAATIAT